MDLVVDKLAVTRGGLRVLEGVTFRLAPGAALVLRGPNGVGKTTLLRCIAGLQRPEAGRVEGAGERVAYAGHADGLKAMLTVRENLDFWAGIYGGGDVPAAFAAYELGGLEDRLAQTLSAGQKRRLGLARLLVTGRPLWLMDEPTVSLDAASVALFARAVKAHLAAGGAALIATHAALGLEADTLELDRFRARADAGRLGAFDEAFA